MKKTARNVAQMAFVASIAINVMIARAQSGEFLLLRAESLTLLPKSKPMLYVQVANPHNATISATVAVKVPASWQMEKHSQRITLAGGEQRRIGFSVTDGDANKSNTYAIEITAEGIREKSVHKQTIAVTSAPYFKPTIDGDPSDWKDAIPVSFMQHGKNTTIATFWNRRRFSLLVSVEEAKLVRRGEADHFDAIQIALAPKGSETSRSEKDATKRFEYLAFADAQAASRCCQLVRPGMDLAEIVPARPLAPLVNEKTLVAVSRADNITHYEVSIPLTNVRNYIRPGEGREFFLSVLVHDPDGTGVRDWGVAAGLWERQRNRLAWSNWDGAQWGNRPPMDCRTQWGMCSSKY